MAARWPQSLDLLTPDDIGDAPIEDAAGRRNLFGWVYHAFPGDSHASDQKRGALVRAIFRAASEIIPGRECGLDELTPAVQARVWNRALAVIGYTEGNPESRKVKG